MKKKILAISVLALSATLVIWGCKKLNEPVPAEQAQAHSPVAQIAGKMSIAQADIAGLYHNQAVDEFLETSLADPAPDPADMNAGLANFFDENGFTIPTTFYDYETWLDDVQSAIASDKISAANFSSSLYNDGVLNTAEKFYVDMAVGVIEDLAASIDSLDEDCDPDERPDSVAYHRIDSIQHLVVNDGNLSDESNDKLLVGLSIMKYSGLYWYGCDQFGNRRAAKVMKMMGLNNPRCKACVKAKWGLIVFADAFAGFAAFSLGANWGSIAVAVVWSMGTLQGYCPSCR